MNSIRRKKIREILVRKYVEHEDDLETTTPWISFNNENIKRIMRRFQTIEESRVTSSLDLSLPSISNATTCHALLPPTKSIFEPRF